MAEARSVDIQSTVDVTSVVRHHYDDIVKNMDPHDSILSYAFEKRIITAQRKKELRQRPEGNQETQVEKLLECVEKNGAHGLTVLVSGLLHESVTRGNQALGRRLYDCTKCNVSAFLQPSSPLSTRKAMSEQLVQLDRGNGTGSGHTPARRNRGRSFCMPAYKGLYPSRGISIDGSSPTTHLLFAGPPSLSVLQSVDSRRHHVLDQIKTGDPIDRSDRQAAIMELKSIGGGGSGTQAGRGAQHLKISNPFAVWPHGHSDLEQFGEVQSPRLVHCPLPSNVSIGLPGPTLGRTSTPQGPDAANAGVASVRSSLCGVAGGDSATCAAGHGGDGAESSSPPAAVCAATGGAVYSAATASVSFAGGSARRAAGGTTIDASEASGGGKRPKLEHYSHVDSVVDDDTSSQTRSDLLLECSPRREAAEVKNDEENPPTPTVSDNVSSQLHQLADRATTPEVAEIPHPTNRSDDEISSSGPPVLTSATKMTGIVAEDPNDENHVRKYVCVSSEQHENEELVLPPRQSTQPGAGNRSVSVSGYSPSQAEQSNHTYGLATEALAFTKAADRDERNRAHATSHDSSAASPLGDSSASAGPGRGAKSRNVPAQASAVKRLISVPSNVSDPRMYGNYLPPRRALVQGGSHFRTKTGPALHAQECGMAQEQHSTRRSATGYVSVSRANGRDQMRRAEMIRERQREGGGQFWQVLPQADDHSDSLSVTFATGLGEYTDEQVYEAIGRCGIPAEDVPQLFLNLHKRSGVVSLKDLRAVKKVMEMGIKVDGDEPFVIQKVGKESITEVLVSCCPLEVTDSMLKKKMAWFGTVLCVERCFKLVSNHLVLNGVRKIKLIGVTGYEAQSVEIEECTLPLVWR